MATALRKAAKPKPIRRDPAGFKVTERENARILIGLVDDFAELVLRGVLKQDGRALADPLGATMAAFVLRLVQDVEGSVDSHAARPAAIRTTDNAVKHGQKWADKALVAQGITPASKTGTVPLSLPPERAMIELAQANMLSEIKGLTNDVSKRLSRTLVEGYSNGETINQLAKRVKVATDFSRNRAITIARTETLRVGNEAAVERYKSHGVEQVEYIAASDDVTCEECESLNGNIYELGSEPDLPIHPNCRCTYAAVIERD